MRLIIHAGFGKAGSTTIQGALRLNARHLMSAGYLTFGEDLRLVADGTWRGIPQWMIQHAAQTKTLLTPQIAEEIAGRGGTAIISSENLEFPYMPALFEGLDDVADVEVVFYLRPQIGYIPSAWKQWFSKDGTSLTEFVQRCLNERKPDYRASIEAWERMLPKAKITVRVFVREAMAGGDPARDFFDILGLPPARLPGAANQSLDFALTHLMMRNADKVFKGIHDTRVEQKLCEILPPIYQRVNSVMLSQEAADKITARFKNDTLHVLRQYCNIDDAEAFYRRHFTQKAAEKSYMEMSERDIVIRAFHVLLNTVGEDRMAHALGSILASEPFLRNKPTE